MTGDSVGLLCVVFLLHGCFILCSCKAFHPEAVVPVPSSEGNLILDRRYLRKKQTVEAKGVFKDDRFHAKRFDIEDPDDEIEAKSTVTRLNEHAGKVGGVSFSLDDQSKIVSSDGERVGRDAVPIGSWAKVECREGSDGLVLRKLSQRMKKEGEEEELQGLINKLERGKRRLFIGETEVVYDSDVSVLWKRDGIDPPALSGVGDLGVASIFRTSKGVRKIKRVDDDDQRPEDQLTFGGFLTVGGEVQFDLEWRDNHDLNDLRARDRLIPGFGVRLEFSFDVSDTVFGFFQVSSGYRYVAFDQDRDIDFDNQTRIGEAFVLVEDFLLEGVAVQVGRQDFDHGREWVFDENLDAVRFYVNLEPVLLEVSWSSVLYQESREQEGVQNLILGIHAEPRPRSEVFAYVVNRRDGKLTDFDRTHVGVSAKVEIDGFKYWMDTAYVFGKENHVRVEGYGIDQMLLHRFDVDMNPSVYAGFAWGSGDDDPARGEDHNFRQTGLNDNNGRLNGVTSFRYLGELVRPELSNIAVTTIGTGLRSNDHNSVDIVYHRYRQVEAASFLGGSRLRRTPQGASKDIGNSLDLILGIEKWSPLEIEFVLGYFVPGSAFVSTADPAWFGALQVEWNF